MTRIILNFHGIGDPHDGVPGDERPYWLSVERFQHVVDRAKAYGDIAFTFDDGNRSDLDIAAPALEAAGLRGAFFILTGRFGQPEYLGPDDIRTLKDRGHEIGLHGRDHIDWRDADDATFHAETVEARADLAEALGSPIDTVGIPFGAYNKRVLTALRAQGFRAIYTSDRGPAERGPVISRNTLRADMNDAEIDAILAGQDSLKTRARRAAGKFKRRHLS